MIQATNVFGLEEMSPSFLVGCMNCEEAPMIPGGPGVKTKCNPFNFVRLQMLHSELLNPCGFSGNILLRQSGPGHRVVPRACNREDEFLAPPRINGIRRHAETAYQLDNCMVHEDFEIGIISPLE